MTPTIKEWTTALRSGEYDQGRASLHCDDRFCCLGVLCDLVDPDAWKAQEDGDPRHIWRDDGVLGLPPRAVLKAVGISYEQALSLANRNDNGYTFDQLADVIEKEYHL